VLSRGAGSVHPSPAASNKLLVGRPACKAGALTSQPEVVRCFASAERLTHYPKGLLWSALSFTDVKGGVKGDHCGGVKGNQ
jgi:hypothetical protein